VTENVLLFMFVFVFVCLSHISTTQSMARKTALQVAYTALAQTRLANYFVKIQI
jgi:hypothetical protein